MELCKCIFILIALSLCPMAWAQSTDHNYVKTVTYLNSDGSDSIVSVQYYDGLGRPDQQVVGGTNTSGKYLYTYTEYDGLGRESKVWSPVVGGTNLDYMAPSAIAGASQTLYSDSKGYSQMTYDALDRPLFVSTPGEAWYENHKGKTTEYCTNGAKEVRLITPNTLQNTKTYHAAGTLYGTRAWNEDGITTLTFKDMLGRVILERRGNEAPYADTYYVYNELNQLVYVLPPMYNEGPTVAKVALYAYQYSYDNRGRMTSKTLPGCQPITYEYDNADRVIEMRDGVLTQQGKCRRYTYDRLGRLKTQSICYDNTDKTWLYYEIVNYYDCDAQINRNNKKLDISTTCHYGIGQITAISQRTSNGDSILTTFTYDEYGRVIRQEELGLDRHLTETEIGYNFVGNDTIRKVKEYVYEGGQFRPMLEAIVRNTYAPHTKLPFSSLLYLTEYRGGVRQGTDTITMQDLSYNDLGRVIANNRSGNAGDVCYAYDNLHGWLTGINTGAGFEQRMYRETNGAHPRWDGCISAMAWRTDDETIHRYDYEYDVMNRLLKVDYSTSVQMPSLNNAAAVLSSTNTLSGIRSIAKKASSTLSNLQSFIPASEESSLTLSSQTRVTKPGDPINPIDPIDPIDPVDPEEPFDPVDPSLSDDSSENRQGDLTSMESLIGDNLAFDNNQHYNEEITYDANCNIKTLKRYGMKNSKGFGLIDKLSFGYRGNQRAVVSDSVKEILSYNGAFDFVNGNKVGDDYSYNENGALSKDLNKKILSIEYDFLGNPKTITLTQRRSIEYVYSADGRRLRAIHKTGTISEKTDYIGNLILKGGKPEMYRFAGGYASFDADTINGCHYYIADYLGNNRMVVNASTDEVEQVNHYYAYGGIIGNLSSNEGLQEFKFGDKKLDRTYGLDLYDFEARQYDAITPWFTSIDPLAEKFTWLTPYNYCAGDPVNLVDRDGRAYYDVSKDGSIVMRQDEHVNDKTDFLYAEGVKSPIEIKDRSILENLSKGKQATSKSEEVLSVFFFVSANTSKEWSASAWDNGDYTLTTSNEDSSVLSSTNDCKTAVKWMNIHSHPGFDGNSENGTRGGSVSDLANYDCAEKDRSKNGQNMLLAFVYHKGDNMTYRYNRGGSTKYWTPKVFISAIPQLKEMYKNGK